METREILLKAHKVSVVFERLEDGKIRIVFLRPQDTSSRIGHVALVHNGKTLESHGGVGPNSRAWTNTGWQAKAFVYILRN